MDFSEVYSYMTDSDGDGYYDIHDVDADEDGIPDYLEFDEGGGGEWGDEPNGVYDYLEWDMDDDGDVDSDVATHYRIDVHGYVLGIETFTIKKANTKAVYIKAVDEQGNYTITDSSGKVLYQYVHPK